MFPKPAYFLAGLIAATFAGGIAQAQSPKTVLDGVYSEAQARRGQNVYDRNCARCHGAGLDGGGGAPALRTFTFLDAWREDYLNSLFLHIQTRMPPGSLAGTLKEDQYTDIVAYILEINKFPAGPGELTRAGLDTTLLTGPSGPQPLPPSATVRAVGCLAHKAGAPNDNAWTLARASTPSRVRNGSETDPAELDRSAHAPLGTRTMRLLNLDDDHTEADLVRQVAQRVQVKGVFNGEGTDARIYVLSFESLGQKCDQ